MIAVVVSLTGSMLAQHNPDSETARKIVSRVAPGYPELAKRMHIEGSVKIEAMVRPNGTVRTTRVMGGNPVLVDAAVAAVTKWKFEAAPTETTEIVQLAFGAQ